MNWDTPDTKKSGNFKKEKHQIAIIQWVSEEDELDDIYYYNIRLGIEKRAQELDYEILRYFNDIPFNLAEEVIGSTLYRKVQYVHRLLNWKHWVNPWSLWIAIP